MKKLNQEENSYITHRKQFWLPLDTVMPYLANQSKQRSGTLKYFVLIYFTLFIFTNVT